MSFITAILLALVSAPLSLDFFMDEQAAANALDEASDCLGSTAFKWRNDKRDPQRVAADIVVFCKAEAATLRAALLDVYLRKPGLLPPGPDPKSAAHLFVGKMHESVESVIREGRKHK